MTALTLERAAGPGSLFDERTGGGPTLDDVISSVWEAVRTGAPASCPVCSGPLLPLPRAGSGGDVPRARCRDCGSELT